jgi:hypothetical protein
MEAYFQDLSLEKLAVGILVVLVIIAAVVRSRQTDHKDEALQMIRRKQRALAKKQQKLSDLEVEITAKQKK